MGVTYRLACFSNLPVDNLQNSNDKHAFCMWRFDRKNDGFKQLLWNQMVGTVIVIHLFLHAVEGIPQEMFFSYWTWKSLRQGLYQESTRQIHYVWSDVAHFLSTIIQDPCSNEQETNFHLLQMKTMWSVQMERQNSCWRESQECPALPHSWESLVVGFSILVSDTCAKTKHSQHFHAHFTAQVLAMFRCEQKTDGAFCCRVHNHWKEGTTPI